ncbi:hypothetical protein [Pararhodobacter aggregans]|uniref:hypothetical protein n=1 Tax=Pararhodobacter aggregans TaxID=404875 RepID=UPI003A908B66
MAIIKRNNMEEDLLREIAEQYLLPFFSGAKLHKKSSSSSSAEQTVAFVDPQTIAFKVNRLDGYRLRITRDQPFETKTGPARETKVIEAFVDVLRGMNNELQGPLKADLLSTFQRRVVARAVAERGEDRQLLAVIDQMALWASRLYEGAPISSAIGVDPDAKGAPDLDLRVVADNDFGAVLSNGFDTLLVFDRKLKFAGHEIVDPGSGTVHACPWRHSAVAQWTVKGDGRVAIVLNRLGEILVFRDGQLLFARRSGTWHFLTHGPILGQMRVPRDRGIRIALYETALDASFARSGACLGVVSSGSAGSWEKVIAETDRLDLKASVKSKALSKVVAGRKFHELDRTLRQELVAIDGATVITHEGKVLAVGAILQIDGGSTGGGRTAAARALARLGLGIKISQDGGITAYRSEAGQSKGDQVAFKVM